MLTFGSLFAGVGGFDLGFEQAGFSCGFQVEWDKDCQQTLAHHWPDVPRWSDVRDVNGAELPPVDVITYGFPCQDLSVAGNRAGLDGGRSGLFFEAVRIIKEMREATNGRYPTWAVAENVCGLLNADNGHAMGRCLDELAKAGSLVIEWCVVDAQWFGIPQRRRRVFIATCFDPATAERCPDPLFPLAESGARNPAEVAQARQESSETVGNGVGGDGIQRVTGTLAAGAHPGSYNGQDAYNDLLLPFVKAKRAQSETDDETWEENRPSPTLNQFDTGDTRTTTAIVFHPHYWDGARLQTGDTSPTVTARWGTGGNNGLMIAQTTTHDVVGTLQARSYKGPSNENARDGELIIKHPIAFTQNQREEIRDLGHLSAGLTAAPGTHQQTYIAQPDLAVRRLTPIECERLMGWPDDHTAHRADGKKNSESARYRMCGNGVAAPVAKWIAKQLRPLV